MYMISDTDTDTASERGDDVLPSIHALPTSELPSELPRVSILDKRVSELENKMNKKPKKAKKKRISRKSLLIQ